MLKDKKGFTLIELAIVLVIIGIILGAILKGQALIQNARAKRTLNDMKGLEAMVWTFYDRYGVLPGDCAPAGSGRIDSHVSGNWTLGYLDTSTTAPTALCQGNSYNRPFNDLKYSGIASKTAENRIQFKHALNGPFFLGYEHVNGVDYNVIAVNDIPCWAAKMIDQSVDGGIDAGVGRVRWLNGTSVQNSSNAWTTCGHNEDKIVDMVYFFDKTP